MDTHAARVVYVRKFIKTSYGAVRTLGVCRKGELGKVVAACRCLPFVVGLLQSDTVLSTSPAFAV